MIEPAFRCVVFDLDGTLTDSKVPIEPQMAAALAQVLRRVHTGIITGGRWELIEKQILPYLPQALPTDALRQLHLLPSCGTQYRRWLDGQWYEEFREDLDESDRELIGRVLIQVAKELGLYESQHWGNLIDDRGGQVTYSVFGQKAPLEVKRSWDPAGFKKDCIRRVAAERLPHLSVSSGASSSIDVTAPGVDKSYGVRKLADLLSIDLRTMAFVGDRLDEGGNDASVLSLPDIVCVRVREWADTLRWTEKLLRNLDSAATGSGPTMRHLPTSW